MDAYAGSARNSNPPANLLIHQMPIPEQDDRAAVLAGLALPQKQLSPKYFYDQAGSELFDRITATAAYYPTRTERRIFEDNRHALQEVLQTCDVLIEPGSGNCAKAIPLLDAGKIPHYVPIEISADFLVSACAGLAEKRPEVTVQAVCADFTHCDKLPDDIPGSRRMVFFPGSTIGNFEPEEAARLLCQFRDLAGPGGYLLAGTDLQKDKVTLERAYNDPEGLTAAFNLNLLAHLRKRLGCDYDAAAYAHHAFYNEIEGRIEMHLRANRATHITMDGQVFALREGESIHTENSYKHSCTGFRGLAESQGFAYCNHWTDEREWFSIHLFQVPESE